MSPRISVCRICGRRLSNPRSIAVSMGPICIRRYGVAFEEALQYSQSLGRQLDVGLIENAAILSTQEAYRRRIRRSNSVHNVQVMSRTLGHMEEVRVDICDGTHAEVTTSRGMTYHVTDTSCSCPDFRFHRQESGGSCRHMDAFSIARGQEISSSALIRSTIDEEVRRQARRSFEFIDWQEQEARESVLEVWKNNRPFNGVFISEDNEAWEELLNRASQEWEYKYENALGGTGNSFGIEIEFELPRHVNANEISSALHEAGIIENPRVSPWRSSASPGFWRLETDGSLLNGLELISPVLFDRQESWEQIEKATEILRSKGAKVSHRCGGHIHIGIAPLDHKSYSWQRLSRIGLGYEKLFYRMGGADSEAFRNGSYGRHRGEDYSQPLTTRARYIRGSDSASSARAALTQSRYTLFNASNVDSPHRAKPTLEFRYPNGSLDPRQWQAQIQVANCVMHQAATITNDSPLSRFTPGLMDTRNQLRHGDTTTEATEREYFRRFLDVIGNDEDRLAAAWLFQRGRA